jgi:pimeloyl-ACP methyl ester carboxylesterase
MKMVSNGYADVNGIKLYHEIHGEGDPLVLIHGGLTTIGEMQGWLQRLAKTRLVIAVEMQGHGRTADTDRPMSFPTMGDDIAALLDDLKIPKADLVGHSFGGASAIRTAIQHPEKVRRLVVISSPYARSGWYPEAQLGMSQVGAAMAENVMQTPTGKFSKQWPEPQRFPPALIAAAMHEKGKESWCGRPSGVAQGAWKMRRKCAAAANVRIAVYCGRLRERRGFPLWHTPV